MKALNKFGFMADIDYPGRIVANMAQCFAAPNMKARMSMKKTRARLGARMARKAQRTKRTNPASIALKRLNRRIK
mgnify:CR=1 FL=1